MIIKTERLQKQIEDKLWQITPNKNVPLKSKGSYFFKPDGSFVTDIDYTANVKYNDGLINVINVIIDKVKRYNNFIFINFSCGVYKDFILPWKIKGTSCEFNYDKTIEWYNNIKTKNILSVETQKFIEDILFKDNLSIKELIEIDKELEKYYDIKWYTEDLKRGYIVDKYDNVTRYDFLETLKTNVGVVKFLFIYYQEDGGKDYIPIDLGLVDDLYFQNKELITSFYIEDWYKIFKGYKWIIDERYKEEYIKSFVKLDYQNSLLNRLKMLKRIKQSNLLTDRDFKILEQKIIKETKDPRSGLDQKINNISAVISILSKNIIKNLKEDVLFFKDKLTQKDEIIKQNMFYDRVMYANIPIQIEELKQRTEKGINCPFYQIDGIEYDFLYKASLDFLLNPIEVINCFIQIANEHNIQIKNIINTEKIIDIVLQEDDNNIIINRRVYREIYIRKINKRKIKTELVKIKETNKKNKIILQKALIESIFKY